MAGYIVSPGLIDMHTHVYWGGTSLGIDPDEFCRTSGVTTSIDTGSAGPGNWLGFRKHVIERSEARILAYLHVSFAGIFGFSKTVMEGESKDIRMMAPAECAEVADQNRDLIVGIKVRVGRHASGDQGTKPLNAALQTAEWVGMPLMAHIDHPPPSYEEVLDMLRPGDVLTHAFRPFPNAPCTAQGHVKEAVLRARKRGVFFDIGHGKASFAFRTARAMLANGFYPDTISSDVHALCIDGPAFDQVTTMSKFLCMGMSLNDVIKASTVNAAVALQRMEYGSLKAGSLGDATILSVKGRQVRLCRRCRRASDRRPAHCFRRRGAQGQMVAPARSRKFAKLKLSRDPDHMLSPHPEPVEGWMESAAPAGHPSKSSGSGLVPDRQEHPMSPEDKLKNLGLTLPEVAAPIANYVRFKQAGELVFLSGQGPRKPDGTNHTGKVGADVTVEQAYEHAKLTGLGLLAAMKAAAGSLDRVEVVKLLGMVNATPDFTQHRR